MRVTVPDYMTEIVATLSPPRPLEPAHQPALRRVGAAHRRQPRDDGRQRHPPGAAPRREGRRPAHQRPRGARRVDDGQDRDRVARGGPRRADRREPREGGGAHGVQGPVHARALPRRSSRRSRRARSSTPARTSPRPSTSRCSSSSRRCARPVTDLTGGDESAASVASAVEFVLEGLHLSKRLNKDAVGARATYRARA